MPQQGTKPCTTCLKHKPLNDYGADKRARDGRQGRCRECCRAAKKAKYYANIEAARAAMREWRQGNLARAKELAKQSRERNRESVLAGKTAYYNRVKQDPAWQQRQAQRRQENRERKRAYDRNYTALNSRKKAAQARAWAARNPERRASICKSYDARRRSQKQGGDSTAAIHAWESIAPKVCYWCGVKCTTTYHVDHYVPLSKGGRHEIANLVIACGPCNIKKNAKDPYVFAASVGRLF